MQRPRGRKGAHRRALCPGRASEQPAGIRRRTPAEQANDLPSAIAAFKQFLVLSPDDPSAAPVKQQIALLEQQLKTNSLLQPSG